MADCYVIALKFCQCCLLLHCCCHCHSCPVFCCHGGAPKLILDIGIRGARCGVFLGVLHLHPHQFSKVLPDPPQQSNLAQSRCVLQSQPSLLNFKLVYHRSLPCLCHTSAAHFFQFKITLLSVICRMEHKLESCFGMKPHPDVSSLKK